MLDISTQSPVSTKRNGYNKKNNVGLKTISEMHSSP